MNQNEFKYLSESGLKILTDIIKTEFARLVHNLEISDVNGLERRLDELTPPEEIQTSDDVIIKINQLSLRIKDLTDEISELNSTVDSLIPSIGEIYITVTDENPSLKFGGTWEQIKDMFLLASGDAYVAGSIGGEAVHTLTVDEMPSHTHTYKRHEFNRTDIDPETGEDVYGANNKTLGARMGISESTGGGQPHNNMPPYLAVYVWKRVS